MDALSGQGEFKNGVFRRRGDVEGKRNMDGYQAIWEHANGKPMVYPTPRYSRPFLMDPAAYAWAPVAGAAGVSEKLLGVFTERRSSIRALKIESGHSYRLEGRAILIVFAGTGSVAGHDYRRFSVQFLEWDESAEILATDTTEALVLGMPDLRAMMGEHLAIAAE